MTQTIEQLTARVRELEEEKRIAELIAELEHIREQKNLLWFEFSIATQQLAAEQLNNKLLRDALNAMLNHMGMDEDEGNKPTFDQTRNALATPPDDSALRELLRAERERCAEECEEHAALGASATFCAEAIRAMEDQ